MPTHFEHVERAIGHWAAAHGIHVETKPMPSGTAGEFHGISATMNSSFRPEERAWYLVHALGSIVLWSVDRPAVQEMFNELRDAKQHTPADRPRLERAIARYRDFEIESSEHAVWLLAELGCSDVIPRYTNFLRADLESMTEFHRTGTAPVWRTFFARWNEDVAAGRREVLPFHPRLIPPFTPVAIEKQEILQQQGGPEA